MLIERILLPSAERRQQRLPVPGRAPIKIVVSNKTNFGLSLTLTQPNNTTKYLINIPSQTILIVDGVWMISSYSFVTYDGKNTYP